MTLPLPDADFLARTGLFRGLPPAQLQLIAEHGENLRCGPGHVLVEQGSQGGDLYVVKSGVLEARDESEGRSSLVGYVFPGECVGEMSILTGSPRSVTVRVPEQAEIFRVPGAVFERVLRTDVEVAIAVARGLAMRLERANKLSPPAPFGEEDGQPRHLSGDLQYFDVPEVCQTLIQSRRSGTMSVTTSMVSGGVELCFEDGDFRYARAGVLTGADAVLYLLRTKLSGRFEFRAGAPYRGPDVDRPIRASSMALLLEAAQQKDEMDALVGRLPGPEHVFEVLAPAFPFEGPLAAAVDPDEADPGDALRGAWQPTSEAERELARSLWDAIAAGQPFGRVLADRRAKEPLALQIVHTLVKRRAIR